MVVAADARRPAGAPAPSGDALVTAEPADVLAVITADCASIALGSPEGPFAAVHAGWRGLVAGVVEEAAAALRSLGASSVRGALGPTASTPSATSSGPGTSIWWPAGWATACGARRRPAARRSTSRRRWSPPSGAPVWSRCPVSTPAPPAPAAYFSHRARRDAGRQALVVWSAAA